MLRRHSHPADHIHFNSGFTGWLRWTLYWVVSRATNIFRTLLSHWRARLRPSLEERRAALADRAKTAITRTADRPGASLYPSLADAVRGRGLVDKPR